MAVEILRTLPILMNVSILTAIIDGEDKLMTQSGQGNRNSPWKWVRLPASAQMAVSARSNGDIVAVILDMVVIESGNKLFIYLFTIKALAVITQGVHNMNSKENNAERSTISNA